MSATTIWKFPLGLQSEEVVAMPGGARLLCVATQHGNLMLWAEVDPDSPVVGRRIGVVGTGHPFSHGENREYVGTVFAGPFVWHVYDLGEE